MTWIALAAADTPPPAAAQAMRCDVRQALRRLDEARHQLRERRQNCQEAAALLRQSGYQNPAQRAAPSRRNWQDVALGLKKAGG